MTKDNSTTSPSTVVNLNDYRSRGEVRALRFASLAARLTTMGNAQPAFSALAPAGFEFEERQKEAIASINRLLVVDEKRVAALHELKKIVAGLDTVADAPTVKIAMLIADRDFGAFERENLSSAVWYDAGLVGGVHALDEAGDIVDSPRAAFG